MINRGMMKLDMVKRGLVSRVEVKVVMMSRGSVSRGMSVMFCHNKYMATQNEILCGEFVS